VKILLFFFFKNNKITSPSFFIYSAVQWIYLQRIAEIASNKNSIPYFLQPIKMILWHRIKEIYDYSCIALRTDLYTLAICGCFVPSIYSVTWSCKEETFCLFAEAMNTVLPFPWKKGITPQVIDKYDGIIRKSFLILEFHSTIIQELRLKFITILLLIFHNVVGILSNKSPSNCMTQRLISS
jgi:hypothetical protein